MKQSKSEVIYILIGLLAIIVASVAYATEIIALKDLVAPLLSLFGTFCGALFAFRLNQAKEDKKLHSLRQEAINRVCFGLSRQANVIRQFKMIFEQIQDPTFRALQLPASKPPKYDSITLNVTELDFLLETEHREILLRLTIEYERFHAAIEAINLRNEFYVNEFQPKLSDVGLNCKAATAAEFKEKLGERIYGTVVNQTTIALDHLKASNNSLRIMTDDLIKAAKAIYPDKEFINFKLSEEDNVAAK